RRGEAVRPRSFHKAGAVVPRDLRGAVRRAGVHHDEFVHKINDGVQAGRQVLRLVFDDHAQGNLFAHRPLHIGGPEAARPPAFTHSHTKLLPSAAHSARTAPASGVPRPQFSRTPFSSHRALAAGIGAWSDTTANLPDQTASASRRSSRAPPRPARLAP